MFCCLWEQPVQITSAARHGDKLVVMKAKGHHFIPQFLLKGFGSRHTKAECYCWYFHRSSKPCEANIKGIGQQRHFHGDPRHTNLEEIIAERESIYAAVIQRLQNGEIKGGDKPLIDEFVAHLVIRGRNLRQGFLKATDDLLTEMVHHLMEPKNRTSRNDRLFEYVTKDPTFSNALASISAEGRELFLKRFRRAMDELPIETGMQQVLIFFNNVCLKAPRKRMLMCFQRISHQKSRRRSYAS
jgi:hypothetical protein